MFFIALSMCSIVYFSTALHAYPEAEFIQGSHVWSGTVAEIMQTQDQELAAPTQGQSQPHHFKANRDFAHDKLAFDELLSTPPLKTSALLQAIPINTLATTFAECHSWPPDTMGDVGPTQYIVSCNGRIKTLSKISGLPDGILNVSLGGFLNSVSGGFQVSDPRIRYDRTTRRWFLIAITVSTPNRVLLAMSNESNITTNTNWHFFFFHQELVSPPGDSTCLADYPTLGIDSNGLYIGVNQFCSNASPTVIESEADENTSFNGTTAFVIQKAPLVSSNTLRVFAFRHLIDNNGNGPYTPQGVDNFDHNPSFGYFIGVNASTSGQLSLIEIGNVATAPFIAHMGIINVPHTSDPLLIPHLGNNNGVTGYLDSIDDRLMYAHIRNGHLWTCHNVGVDNNGSTSGSLSRTGCRWYEIDLTGTIPSVVQVGTVFTSSPNNDRLQRNYWMPSLMTTGPGHMVLGCSAAGANEFINAAFTTRLRDDAPNTTRTPYLYTAATTAYNPNFDSGSNRGRRWGDYSSTRLDPLDNMTIWTVQEYCNDTNSYGIRLAKILAPAPATPVSITPATIARDVASTSVIVRGSSVDGTGFYDPGVYFPHRLLAHIDGGVTVTSINYINPTELHLTVSTVGAMTGSRKITITNPDRQSVSAIGLLHVS